MYQSGQIAVALSRCKTKKGLRIFNFCQKLLRKPNEDVLDFYNRIQAYPQRNLSCCCSLQIDDTKSEESPIQGNRNVSKLQSESDDDTEFDEEDDEIMDSLLNVLDEVENISDFEYEIPETVHVENCLDAVKNKFTITEKPAT